jgi:hypothetical protein
MSRQTSGTQQVFRQRSPLWLAGVCALIGLFLLFSVARSWADDPEPLSAAWVVLVLAMVWSLYVRPAVVLDDEGVVFRNILRDFHIPWVQVTDVESRWNLKVFVGDRGYTAWAISSQIGRPKRPGGGPLGSFSPSRLDKYAGAAAAPPTSAPKVTASMVARLIETARDDYEEAVARGALPARPDARVRVTWAPLVMAVLLLPAIAVVILTLR